MLDVPRLPFPGQMEEFSSVAVDQSDFFCSVVFIDARILRFAVMSEHGNLLPLEAATRLAWGVKFRVAACGSVLSGGARICVKRPGVAVDSKKATPGKVAGPEQSRPGEVTDQGFSSSIFSNCLVSSQTPGAVS